MIVFILAVHCEWDEWILGECSATCGAGTRTNTRVKLVEESNGGTCDGQTIEIEECQVSECPSKYIDLRCNIKGIKLQFTIAITNFLILRFIM